jgi:hypothetical protein
VNTSLILSRLQQIVGNLRPAPGTSAEELRALQRSLAQQLIADPAFRVLGNRVPDATAPPADPSPASGQFSHLSDMLERSAAPKPAAAPPLVFQRETAFRSSLLGNSVPEWGSGLAVSRTFGPFIDQRGIPVWFDFYNSVRMVSVYLNGGGAAAMLIPFRGTVTPSRTFRIEAGSVWIASDLITNNSSLSGYYTGLKVRGGSLELSAIANVSSGNILVPPLTFTVLQLDLNPNAAVMSGGEAGVDVNASIVSTPGTITLIVNSVTTILTASDASCTVFGCAATFRFAGSAPRWLDQLGQILVPYSVSTNAPAPDRFQIDSSESGLCTLAQSAPIASDSGWLLPAAKVNPSQLGDAAGTGSLCISTGAGLTARWKGLTGTSASLIHPYIVGEPGLLSVVDFTAQNRHGKQKWILWRNLGVRHHSEIAFTFAQSFPLLFISSTTNTEVLFFCGNYKASLDRPVDAGGSPFSIDSVTGLAGIVQSGSAFRALLMDTYLFFGGNATNPGAFQKCSIVLRNALFSVTPPMGLFLFGDLQNDNAITTGNMTLTFGIYGYLPTLPDPYAASYTAFLQRLEAGGFANGPSAGLAAHLKWPDPADAIVVERDEMDNPAYVSFGFVPLEPPTLPSLPGFPQPSASTQPAVRDFRTGAGTFQLALAPGDASARSRLSILAAANSVGTAAAPPSVDGNAAARVRDSIASSELPSIVAGLEANPLLGHIQDMALQVDQTLAAALRNTDRASATSSPFALTQAAVSPTEVSLGTRGGGFGADYFTLLDLSSNADQMGVSMGAAIQVDRSGAGETTLRSVASASSAATMIFGEEFKIAGMDVVAASRTLRALTLPQVSWEPIFNIPLEIEGTPDPNDLITVTPGILVYDNDGLPTRIFSDAASYISIAPLSVTTQFLRAFNDANNPSSLYSLFTLPFGLVAEADFIRTASGPGAQNPQLSLHMPYFDRLRGGLQIQALAPPFPPQGMTPYFAGLCFQVSDNIKWFVYGMPITGSTLGNTIKTIFNQEFFTDQPKVPLGSIELSGYGASIFSNWRDENAAVAQVSQAKFDVIAGRTAHEVVQVRSILYPYGVHVVRTVTLMRSPSGYVFRSDSGWKAESNGFYDFSYTVNFDTDPPIAVPNPFVFHAQPVKGVSNVREIKDFPDGGTYQSSFRPDDPDLPPAIQAMGVAQWHQLFNNVNSKSDTIPVEMHAVTFDADVHLDNVVSGGKSDPVSGDFTVQSRKMLGYVQVAPSSILVSSRIVADLLRSQNGSLGGPVDCILSIANSEQRMRLSRVDVNPALDAAGKNIFVTAARGSLILPPDGAWSLVKQHTDTGDVKPIEEGQSVPLIKPNASPNFKLADPADAVRETASMTHFGVLQSTGTQKLLFDVPQFSPNQKKLKSAVTYFADAYKLLNSTGVFPNVANALTLTNAEKEVEILGEGLMRMPDRDIDLGAILPSNYQYAFIDEPGILKIYAEYKSTQGDSGKLKLGIDSTAAAADKWKAVLSSIRVVVNLGPFDELMWVDGTFHAASSLDAKYDVPQLQFGDVLKPVKDLLQVLQTLTGGDFDNGMDIGMSNSPDNWEYKFNCSQAIPVIKFPSPEELTIDPNPPLKLEAGLRVGFYFNEVLSIPTDVKQLVPACGAFVDFHGGLEVMCFSLAAASVYAVGQVDLGIEADTKAGVSLHMKFAFGVELVVGLPVVGNVAVMYSVGIEIGISSAALDVGATMMFRGSAEICGGLVAVCIQIEAAGSIHRAANETDCIAQVTFSIDVSVLWVIDISFSDSWQETRQIA